MLIGLLVLTHCTCADGQTGVRNLSWYLRMKPLRLPFKFVDVKLLVENHLNCAFYTYSVMPNYDNKVCTMLYCSSYYRHESHTVFVKCLLMIVVLIIL